MTARWITVLLIAVSVTSLPGQVDRREQSDPTYVDLRNALRSEAGPQIWAELRGKLTPLMTLYVVSVQSDRLRLSPTKDGPAEVQLDLRAAPERAVRTGDEVEFDGIAESLERSPLLLGLVKGSVRRSRR